MNTLLELNMNDVLLQNKHMKTRKWNKKNLQQILKALRNAKGSSNQHLFKVIKKDSSYEVRANKNNKIVLSAMLGRFDYLVRFDTRLFNKKG